MVLRQLITLVLPLAVCCAATAGPSRPTIGAIRWDAWHTGEGPAKNMEASLGPKQYNHRLPFFAEVLSERQVKIGGYDQHVMDREIAFAKAGGIDYWAFLLYDPDSPMSQGLSFYLSSKRKLVRFCTIATPNMLGDAKSLPEKTKRIIDLMVQPTYQKTPDGRPLFYLFNLSEGWLKSVGGETGARGLLDGFRAAVRDRGLRNPYIVLMEFDAAKGARMAQALGAEAVSSYAVPGDQGKNGTPYSGLTQFAKQFWESCAATGAEVVPIAMAGWDRRPRIEHPVPWEKYQKPGEGMEKYFQTPTPQELAAHIEDAMHWVDLHPAQCPARTVIVYAWNEHDEGGWLCPTLNPDGSPNADRLDAIANMRREFR